MAPLSRTGKGQRSTSVDSGGYCVFRGIRWSHEKSSYIVEKLTISEDQHIASHNATIGQRDNPSWHIVRKGRLTASTFGVVLNCTRATPSLIKRVLGQYDLSRVQANNCGIINENEGKKALYRKTGLCIEKCGIWLDLSGMLGASPDGLIGKDVLLEIKCPFTQKESTIEEAVCSSKFFIVKHLAGIEGISIGIRCRGNYI